MSEKTRRVKHIKKYKEVEQTYFCTTECSDDLFERKFDRYLIDEYDEKIQELDSELEKVYSWNDAEAYFNCEGVCNARNN